MAVRRASVALLCAAALGATACQRTAAGGPPVACTEGADAVLQALRDAPRDVRLRDGTRLSECVATSRSDAALQEIGAVLTAAAEQLEGDASTRPREALQLGYLIGAVRRGAHGSSGIHAELVRRIERSGALEGAPPVLQEALLRGLAAGEGQG